MPVMTLDYPLIGRIAGERDEGESDVVMQRSAEGFDELTEDAILVLLSI